MPVTVLQAPLALALTAGSLVLLCSASKSPLRSVVSHIQSFFFSEIPCDHRPFGYAVLLFPFAYCTSISLGTEWRDIPCPL